jgi:hypothetical protein
VRVTVSAPPQLRAVITDEAFTCKEKTDRQTAEHLVNKKYQIPKPKPREAPIINHQTTARALEYWGLRDSFLATLELAEITRVLVCFDHVASFIVHANHSVM